MYPPFLKITTWDFSKLTTRCNLFAVSLSTLSCCWRPTMVLDGRTTSSAKSIIKICKISGDNVIPCLPFRTISLASSLLRRESKTGLQLSPCLRPRLQMNASVRSPPTFFFSSSTFFFFYKFVPSEKHSNTKYKNKRNHFGKF